MQKPTKKAFFFVSNIATVALLIMLQAQSVPAQESIIETIGPWEIRCQSAPTSKARTCALTQTATSTENADTTLGIMVVNPTELKNGVMRILVPLNVYLIGGATLSGSDADIGKAAFSNCTAGGCWADIALDDKTFDLLKKNSDVTVTIYKTPHETSSYQFKTVGLNEGFEKLGTAKVQ